MNSAAQTPLTRWLAQLVNRPTGFSSYSADASNKVFIALKGEKSDGHKYIPDLFRSGAVCGFIVDSRFDLGPYNGSRELFFVSANVHESHRELAGEFRKRFSGKIIAVGGSSGKTSTKEFLKQILTQKFQCFATEKSQNGELGIPKTLEKLNSTYEIGIIEVGIDAPGDMIRHSQLVNPDVAILTSIGAEHLNLLRSVENVFSEERILFDVTSNRGGSCFAPLADPYLARLDGIVPNLHLVDTDCSPFRSSFENSYARQNALLAAHVARYLGMAEPEIQTALDSLVLPHGRGTELALPGNRTIIADHYNANPASLQAGLAHLDRLSKKKSASKILVLGDMLDLGEESAAAHEAFIEPIKSLKPTKIIFVGPEWKKHEQLLKAAAAEVCFFENPFLAADSVPWNTFIGDVSCTLIKGSRGMMLEKILEKIQASF